MNSAGNKIPILLGLQTVSTSDKSSHMWESIPASLTSHKWEADEYFSQTIGTKIAGIAGRGVSGDFCQALGDIQVVAEPDGIGGAKRLAADAGENLRPPQVRGEGFVLATMANLQAHKAATCLKCLPFARAAKSFDLGQ